MSDKVDNDELAAFVTSTLEAIAVGISQSGARQHRMNGHSSFSMPEKVSFDIAVTAKRGDEVGGGLKVQVFSLGAKNTSENQTVSRISFEVPWNFTDTRASTRLAELGGKVV